MLLTPGDSAPWFTGRTQYATNVPISASAGRCVVLMFPGSASQPGVVDTIKTIAQRRDLFDGTLAVLFAVSSDTDDERLRRLSGIEGLGIFWDFAGEIASGFGLTETTPEGDVRMARASYILDARLRVLKVIPFGDNHARDVIDVVENLPPHNSSTMGTPPVLVVPRIFEPEFCQHLMNLYRADAAFESGFMRTDPVTGKSVTMSDPALKKRRDFLVEDETARRQLESRVARRLLPEIQKSFQFSATRMERHVIARYDAAEGGYFRPHRDNTTKATLHRRFAVTINLNAEEYEGGDLHFPEFGGAPYRAPTGGAVVFSCSLLHEAGNVVRGTRFCYLPFLFDEPAEAIRRANLQHLVT